MLSGTAAAAQEMDVMCPGDQRCPASMPVPSLPTQGAAAADQTLNFRPTADPAEVADGQLETQTYEAASATGSATHTVTSNTPVPNPTPGRRAR